MKISVIVPVYNVMGQLSRCVDSLLSNKETDYEIILVDDGSFDGSSELCDEYARKEINIKVIHKENGGVSSARNAGLKVAEGGWIFFVDSDDYVDDMYLSIDDSDADIIEKNYSVTTGSNFIVCEKKFEKGCLVDPDEISYYFVNKRTNALWNKAFKRSLIDGLLFNENVFIGEDFLFFLETIKRVKKYSFSGEGCYFYCEREGSAMNVIEKNLNKRVKLMFDNIQNVKNLTNTPSLKYLRTGVLYTTYAYYFHSIRHQINEEYKLKMENLFCELPLSEMKYITLKGRIKLLVLNCFYSLKHALFAS